MTTKPIPMSDADRDALSKKRDAASPGRWTAQRMEDGAWLVRTDDGGIPYSVAQIPQSRPGYTSPRDRADAVFIAEAYNALPSLLAALAASEERARRAEQDGRRAAFEEAARLIAETEFFFSKRLNPPATEEEIVAAYGHMARHIAAKILALVPPPAAMTTTTKED